MSRPELLPCPFCGDATALRSTVKPDVGGEVFTVVECDECGGEAPLEAWNRHTAAPGVPEPCEACGKRWYVEHQWLIAAFAVGFTAGVWAFRLMGPR